ncbi:MAG: methyltransferase domain-containing protein [Micromonosporaceae bacterium]|nr:methyltransferase domain-containing protein [Micromonosporaceae bacterium]
MSGKSATVDGPAVREALQRTVDALLAGRRGVRALEAGAGKRTRFRLPPDAYVVGVDTDPEAIARNLRLDQRVVADLADYHPTGSGFDLVTCWYVLEHVPDPGGLLDRLAGWTAPGGLLVLAVPHLHSPKALVTKLTPHRFHVWFRRRVLGYRNAGRPGFGPYPTTLRRAIAPRPLTRRLAGHGLVPVSQVYFEDAKQARLRHRLRLTGWRWRAACTLTRVLSLGVLDAGRSEYAAVFQLAQVRR